MKSNSQERMLLWLILIVLVSCIDLWLTQYNLTFNDFNELNPIVNFYINHSQYRSYLTHRIILFLLMGFLGLIYEYEEIVISGFQFGVLIITALGVGSNVLALLLSIPL